MVDPAIARTFPAPVIITFDRTTFPSAATEINVDTGEVRPGPTGVRLPPYPHGRAPRGGHIGHGIYLMCVTMTTGVPPGGNPNVCATWDR